MKKCSLLLTFTFIFGSSVLAQDSTFSYEKYYKKWDEQSDMWFEDENGMTASCRYAGTTRDELLVSSGFVGFIVNEQITKIPHRDVHPSPDGDEKYLCLYKDGHKIGFEPWAVI